MNRAAVFNGLLVGAVALPAVVVAAIATSSPALLARAILSTAPIAASPDPVVAAAETGELGRHIRRTSHDPVSASPFFRSDQPVHIGDRITIAAQDGSKRIYRVRTIQELPTPLAKQADSASTSTVRLMLVTCAEVGNPNARPLRIIVENQTIPGLTPSSDIPQAL